MVSPAFRPAQATSYGQPGSRVECNHRAARAIQAYARKAAQENLSACCGHTESLIRALAEDGKLPKAFAPPSSLRQSVWSMDEDRRFAILDGLAAKSNGVAKPTIYPVMLASTIGRRLRVARQGEIIHGKSVDEWIGVVRRIFDEIATSVEHFYGRQRWTDTHV